jgi:hypothetical protein
MYPVLRDIGLEVIQKRSLDPPFAPLSSRLQTPSPNPKLLEMKIVKREKVKVRHLLPGMYVKSGPRSHWTVIHNLGWRLFHAPYRNDAMAQVIAYTKAGGVFFVWAYSKRDEVVEVVEYDVEPRVEPFYEEYDDRSPWI